MDDVSCSSGIPPGRTSTRRRLECRGGLSMAPNKSWLSEGKGAVRKTYTGLQWSKGTASNPAKRNPRPLLYRGDAGAAPTWVHSELSPDPCRAVETSSGAPEV